MGSPHPRTPVRAGHSHTPASSLLWTPTVLPARHLVGAEGVGIQGLLSAGPPGPPAALEVPWPPHPRKYLLSALLDPPEKRKPQELSGQHAPGTRVCIMEPEAHRFLAGRLCSRGPPSPCRGGSVPDSVPGSEAFIFTSVCRQQRPSEASTSWTAASPTCSRPSNTSPAANVLETLVSGPSPE